MSEAPKTSSMQVRLMPDEIEAIEGIAKQHGIAFAMDHLGLDGFGNEFLRLKRLEEQLEATQKERDAEAERALDLARLSEEQLARALGAEEQFEAARRRADRNQEHLNVECAANARTVKYLREQLEAAQREIKQLRKALEHEVTERLLPPPVTERSQDASSPKSLQEQLEDLRERLGVAHRYLLEDANGETNEVWYYEALRATDITASYPASDPLRLDEADADLAAGRARPASEVFADLDSSPASRPALRVELSDEMAEDLGVSSPANRSDVSESGAATPVPGVIADDVGRVPGSETSDPAKGPE